MGTISFDGGLSTSIITPPTFSYKGVNYYAQGRPCSIGLNLQVDDDYIPVDIADNLDFRPGDKPEFSKVLPHLIRPRNALYRHDITVFYHCNRHSGPPFP